MVTDFEKAMTSVHFNVDYTDFEGLWNRRRKFQVLNDHPKFHSGNILVFDEIKEGQKTGRRIEGHINFIFIGGFRGIETGTEIVEIDEVYRFQPEGMEQ